MATVKLEFNVNEHVTMAPGAELSDTMGAVLSDATT